MASMCLVESIAFSTIWVSWEVILCMYIFYIHNMIAINKMNTDTACLTMRDAISLSLSLSLSCLPSI